MRLPQLSRLLAAFVAGAALLLVAPAAAHAEGGSTIRVGIAPADERDYFHVNLSPGHRTERPALVSNFSNSPVDLLIYPADATVTPQGGFALTDQNAPLHTVGSWIHLGVSKLHLEGHSSTKVTVPISVPVGTEPGDYYGGVIIQRLEPGTTSSVQNGFAVQLNIIERIGARVYLHVAGQAAPGLKVGDLTWTKDATGITFRVPLTNTGNVGLRPIGHLTLNGFNLPGGSLDMRGIDVLLPGTSATLSGRLSSSPEYGFGRATVTIDDGIGHASVATASAAVTIFPLLPALIALATLIALGFAAWRFIRFIRRARAAIQRTEHAGRPRPASHRRPRRVSPALDVASARNRNRTNSAARYRDQPPTVVPSEAPAVTNDLSPSG